MRRRLLVVLCCLLFLACAAAQSNPPQYTITTYAGLGPNNMPALSANLDAKAMAVSASGTLYIASGCRVYQVDGSGTLVAVAGNGRCASTTQAISGNEGLATAAVLGAVSGIAFDSSGTLYIADGTYIRTVDTSGIIHAFAGNPSGSISNGMPAAYAMMSPGGLAVDASNNVYFTEGGSLPRVRKVSGGYVNAFAGTGSTGFSGDGGPATSAQMTRPVALAVDSVGNVYISDPGTFRIRMVNTSGMISTFAGVGDNVFADGPAPYAGMEPGALAFDNAGNLLFTDTYNYRVRMVAGGTVSTIAGNGASTYSGDGGPATLAGIGYYCFALATIPGSGDFYVGGIYRVRQVSAGIISTVAGNGTAAYSGDGVAAIDATFNMALRGLGRDGSGNMYVADYGNYRVRKIAPDTSVSVVAGTGSYGSPYPGYPAALSPLRDADSVAADSLGNVYIADETANAVYKVSTSGTISTFFSTSYPFAVAVDPSDNVYVVSASNSMIYRINPTTGPALWAGTGACTYNGDGIPVSSATLCNPLAIAFDAAGNAYIADTYNYRVRKVDTGGIIHTIAGTGAAGFSGDGGPATSAIFRNIHGIAVDGSGNVFLTDFDNNRVRMVDTNGIMWTIAGTGVSGYSGDGGAGTSATTNAPWGITTDSAGNVYFSEYTGHIRKLASPASASAPVTTVTTTPSPNSNHWFKTQVTVLFSATGINPIQKIVWSVSGPQSSSGEFPGASGSLTLDTEGVNTLTYYAVDSANVESPQTLLVKIDKTAPNPPAIMAYPEPYSDGWNATPVYVMFDPAGDPGTGASGVDTCTAPQVLDTETSGTEVSGTCTDYAGNVSAPASTTIRISFQPADMALVFQPDERLNDGTHVHHIRLMNNGPGNAHSAYFTDEIVRDPVLGVSASAGNCSNSTSFVMCAVDAIAAGTAVDVAIHVTAPKTGWTSHSMKIYALETDPVPTNNTAQMQDGTNHAPVAAAGPDRFVAGSNAAGAQVRLDGSASADPDTDPISFRWTGPFPEGGGVVTGATPTVTLPFGASAVTLTVNDGRLDSAPAKVTVTVTRFRVDVAGGPSGTIASGDAASFQVAVTPELGSFDAPVTLTCLNPPAGVTCSFSSLTVTPGAAAAVTTLTVQTPRIAAHRRSPGLPWSGVFAGAFGVLLFGGRRISRWLLAALCAAAVVALVSCGAMQTASAPAAVVRQPVTMSITVSGTSSGLQQSGTTSFLVR